MDFDSLEVSSFQSRNLSFQFQSCSSVLRLQFKVISNDFGVEEIPVSPPSLVKKEVFDVTFLPF